MRFARLGFFFVVACPLFAAGPPSIIARHRPMHPDNSQKVTFQANAQSVDRVQLSYARFTLSQAADGTHIQTPAQADTPVKICNPAGGVADIECTNEMPIAFPPGSLIVYTATAWDVEGNKVSESYAFAAGDYPWPDDPIPIRLKGDTKSKLDTVFIPDTDMTVAAFRDQLGSVIDQFFKYEPILHHRAMHNFWYSGQQGHYKAFCSFTKPSNYANLLAVADAVGFLYATPQRGCANIPMMASRIDDEKGVVHETSHTLYALQDEYCCNTNYKPQECAPNIYGSLAACQADAANLGYPKEYCTQLQYQTTIKDVWRIDPSGETDACIMGPNQNKKTSVFGAACERRLLWRYEKCAGGECFPSKLCP